MKNDNDFRKEYATKFRKFQAGEISANDWREFCNKYFDKLVSDNKDVFVRLKNR
jgi:hypothetical protein